MNYYLKILNIASLCVLIFLYWEHSSSTHGLTVQIMIPNFMCAGQERERKFNYIWLLFQFKSGSYLGLFLIVTQ